MVKIGIAGIGGIGSNVARYLVQAGVSHLKILDCDQVERANLNRQFYTADQAGRNKVAALVENLIAISPAVTVESVQHVYQRGDGIQLFSDCRIVVEGFDDKILKKYLIEDLSASGSSIVSASGISGYSLDTIRVKRMGNCFIVGDFTSDHDTLPLYPPKIGVISSLMAHHVLQLYQEA